MLPLEIKGSHLTAVMGVTDLEKEKASSCESGPAQQFPSLLENKTEPLKARLTGSANKILIWVSNQI